MLTDTDRRCNEYAERAFVNAVLIRNSRNNLASTFWRGWHMDIVRHQADAIIALRAAELAQQQVQGGAL